MSDDVKFDTKSLDALTKALKDNMSRVRVGILGSKAMRNNVAVKAGRSINAAKSSLKGKINFTTNAAIGAIHEFGGAKMPQRSFLRMPIAERLQPELESSGAFTKEALAQVIREKSLLPWLHSLATLAEKIVGDAFDTGGFGKWPKWKTKGYKNNTGQILVDTQQLRNSITSDVK